ncbi:unnamed protein product, partial [Prorocentrum cordatum]
MARCEGPRQAVKRGKDEVANQSVMGFLEERDLAISSKSMLLASDIKLGRDGCDGPGRRRGCQTEKVLQEAGREDGYRGPSSAAHREDEEALCPGRWALQARGLSSTGASPQAACGRWRQAFAPSRARQLKQQAGAADPAIELRAQLRGSQLCLREAAPELHVGIKRGWHAIRGALQAAGGAGRWRRVRRPMGAVIATLMDLGLEARSAALWIRQGSWLQQNGCTADLDAFGNIMDRQAIVQMCGGSCGGRQPSTRTAVTWQLGLMPCMCDGICGRARQERWVGCVDRAAGSGERWAVAPQAKAPGSGHLVEEEFPRCGLSDQTLARGIRRCPANANGHSELRQSEHVGAEGGARALAVKSCAALRAHRRLSPARPPHPVFSSAPEDAVAEASAVCRRLAAEAGRQREPACEECLRWEASARLHQARAGESQELRLQLRALQEASATAEHLASERQQAAAAEVGELTEHLHLEREAWFCMEEQVPLAQEAAAHHAAHAAEVALQRHWGAQRALLEEVEAAASEALGGGSPSGAWRSELAAAESPDPLMSPQAPRRARPQHQRAR